MTDQRIQQACSGCRQKKIRCMPGTETDDVCQRCERLSLECVIPERRRRTSKKSRLRGRMDILESSYAQILSLLSQKTKAQDGPLRTQDNGPGIETGIPTPIDSDPSLEFRAEMTAIFDSGLDLALHAYRRMSAQNFPFVIIPEDTTGALLTQKRPMLARAIAIVTSWNSPDEQSARRALFLHELSSRYFFKCERSLDLLQALLVFFGWCHWYATPFNSQAYRLGALVVTMALELAIHERPSEITQHEILMKASSLVTPTSRPSVAQSCSHEVGRAYMGAYTVSMYCSLLFRKPSPLTYTPYLHEIASFISANPQQASDTMMIHHLITLRIADDVTKSFDQGSSEMMKGMYDGRIQVLVKAITKQLNDWRATLPPSALNDAKLNRQILLSRIYMYEVGLYHLLEGQTPSVDRIELLLECFNNTREYLNIVLSLPTELVTEWNCMDWRAVNYSVVINSRAAMILDSFCYCNESTQRAAWIDECYDSLCSRISMLGSMVASSEERFFAQLAVDWANAKAAYHQGVESTLIQTTTSPSSGQGPTASIQPQSQLFDIENMYNMSWSTFGGTQDWKDMEEY